MSHSHVRLDELVQSLSYRTLVDALLPLAMEDMNRLYRAVLVASKINQDLEELNRLSELG